MRLVELPLETPSVALSPRAEALVQDATERIATFDLERPAEVPGFIPSDFEDAWRALVAIHSTGLATGRKFLEWGSGLGVVTCLAKLVGFDAVGIEIEPMLVEMADRLAEDHEISVQHARGSFVPAEADVQLDPAGIAWLTTDGPDGYRELELELDDFDVVYAYPWPGEEQVIFDIFAEGAAVGALLLTYHGQEGMKLQRKVS